MLIPGASLGIALAGSRDSVLPWPPMYCLLISVGPGEGVSVQGVGAACYIELH